VDPYYLAQKAMEEGYNPEIILAGRRMNDGMGQYVAQEVVKLMIQKECTVKHGKVLIMGITFKENCPDIRNSKVIDVIEELQKYNLVVDVFDPWANKAEVAGEFGIELCTSEESLANDYDAIVLTVSHKAFKEFDVEARRNNPSVLFDVKAFYDRSKTDGRL
jgi:UDP-N-acetyl-D-galactosamine dehydrogenase